MKKFISIIVISSIFSLIGTFAYFLLSAKGVSYVPEIRTEEMESLTQKELTELMEKRARKMSSFEVVSENLKYIWFYKELFKLWVIMAVTSLFSFLFIENHLH